MKIRKTIATNLLKSLNWDLEQAAAVYWDTPPTEVDSSSSILPSSSSIPIDTIHNWFSQYAADENEILDDGIYAFCNDLGIDTQDILILIISWKLQAKDMCCFTKEEWSNGMMQLGCGSMQDLKNKVPQLKQSLDDIETFRAFYHYCFSFAREPTQKNVPLEIAIPLWEIILLPHYPVVGEWCTFLRKNKSHTISKDTWLLLLEFLIQTKGLAASEYDANEAWPVLVDEFMEWKVANHS